MAENDALFRRKVTVFGGTGFIGAHLVRRLAKHGARIEVVTRQPEHVMPLKPLGDPGQIVAVAGDILDPGAVAAAVARSDHVVNLVGILYERGRQSFRAVHVGGARSIAKAAAEAGVRRLVQLSAIGASTRSPAAYGRSKAAGEAAVRKAFPGATVLRPSVVFGPEDQFFNRFAAMAQVSPVLPLIGGGRTRLQPVYVGDVAEAVVRSLERAETAGATFELGGPQVLSLREIMAYVVHITRRRRLLVPVPFWIADLMAAVLEWLPQPPLTRDQVKMLTRDTVVGRNAKGLADLGITPVAIATVVPDYLRIYRPGGGAARIALA